MTPARLNALVTALTILAAAACSSASGGAPESPAAVAAPATDTEAPATPIERMLEASDVGSIVDARARMFTRQVAVLAGDLTDRELERLVDAVGSGFAPELLRQDIADFVEREAPAGQVEEVVGWLEGGASAEVRQMIDAYQPPVPLEEWLTEYTTDPPSAVRVRLVARWTNARGTGDFFVLLEQALSEAAYAVRHSFRPEAGDFRPLQGDVLLVRLENSFNAAVVTALHAAETVPDPILTSATQEYESDAGQWYVETYQLAVAEAMRAAGARVVDALAS